MIRLLLTWLRERRDRAAMRRTLPPVAVIRQFMDSQR
jgi:hypothetical protein